MLYNFDQNQDPSQDFNKFLKDNLSDDKVLYEVADNKIFRHTLINGKQRNQYTITDSGVIRRCPQLSGVVVGHLRSERWGLSLPFKINDDIFQKLVNKQLQKSIFKAYFKRIKQHLNLITPQKISPDGFSINGLEMVSTFSFNSIDNEIALSGFLVFKKANGKHIDIVELKTESYSKDMVLSMIDLEFFHRYYENVTGKQFDDMSRQEKSLIRMYYI